MKSFWLSSNKMTVCVDTKKSIIIKTPPIVNKFRGQPLDNLIRWMKKQGGFKIKELGSIK